MHNWQNLLKFLQGDKEYAVQAILCDPCSQIRMVSKIEWHHSVPSLWCIKWRRSTNAETYNQKYFTMLSHQQVCEKYSQHLFESEDKDFYGFRRTFGPIEFNINKYLFDYWMGQKIFPDLSWPLHSFRWVWKCYWTHKNPCPQTQTQTNVDFSELTLSSLWNYKLNISKRT